MSPTTATPVRMTAAQLADLLKVGPHGYIHGWVFVGIPGGGGQVEHPELGRGRVTGVGGRKVRVRFDSGAEHSFEHRPGAGRGGSGAGHFVPRGLAADNPAPSVKPGRGGRQGDLLSAESTKPAARPAHGGQAGEVNEHGHPLTLPGDDHDSGYPYRVVHANGMVSDHADSRSAAGSVDDGDAVYTWQPGENHYHLTGSYNVTPPAPKPTARRLGEDTRPVAERVADYHARGGPAMGRQLADPGKAIVDQLQTTGANGGKRRQQQMIAGLSDTEARIADSEFTRRATMLGHDGEVSSTHQMVKDRLAGKKPRRGQ